MTNLDANSSRWEAEPVFSDSRFTDALSDLASEPIIPAPPEEYSCKLLNISSLKRKIRALEIDEKRELYGCFWRERELALLVGSTGAGKSVLSLQIALSIAEGRSIGGFGSACPPQPVLYLDFENDIEDWQKRTENYTLPENLLHADLAVNVRPDEFIEGLRDSIIEACTISGSKVVIIDNITWLLSNTGAKKTDIHQEAGALMQDLNALRKSLGISILVVTHTNKDKGFTPFTLADLSGSSRLQQFAQSIFALGRSYSEPRGRYLKQLKSRWDEMPYSHQVAAFELEPREGLLQLVRRAELDGKEGAFLRDAEISVEEQIRNILAEEPELSAKDVSERIGCSQRYARDFVKGRR